MARRNAVLPVPVVILVFTALYLYAQMPEWKYFRDREGNSYYYDSAMKIRIADDKPFEYTPVSAAGVDYYLHKGIDLVKSGSYVEGLYYLKSIKTLPPGNRRVKTASEDASGWINYLQKKHGVRYERFDAESTILLNNTGSEYNLFNEKLRFRISIKKIPRIIKAAWRLNGRGYGLKFGFNFERENSEPGFDCVVGVESRITRGRIENLAETESAWRNEFGIDNLVREEVLRRNDRVIYTYTYGDGVPFSGIEGVYLNGNIIHLVRVLCSNNIKDRVFEEIKKPVEEMTLVR